MTERRASKLGIFSWMLFDWAAQPYHTLIITFIFAPYFAAYVAPDAAKGQELWGLATGLAGIVIALLAPVLGAMTDASGPRKPWLALFALVAMVGAAGLYLSVPGTDAPVMQVLVFYGLALIGIEFAAVFNNSMMPGLVPRAELGKLSGSGWALGYVGGVVSLILMLVGLMVEAKRARRCWA